MSSQPYDLIALDLDFTLLNAEHRISPRNLAAIRACQARGVRAAVTSGRMFSSTLPYIRALGADGTPAIAYNGALIKRADTGEELQHARLGLDTARALVEFCAREALSLNYYLDDQLYIAKINPWAELYAARTGAILRPVGDLRALTDRAPTKVLIVDAPARISALFAALHPQYSARAYVTISNVEYLEFMPPGVDKGQALAVLADGLGIPRERVIAFGDADNDVPLLRAAGTGVAMENAKPAAKAVADRIAPPYDADGVAQVLEEIFDLPPCVAP